jgi:hypothetical protein
LRLTAFFRFGVAGVVCAEVDLLFPGAFVLLDVLAAVALRRDAGFFRWAMLSALRSARRGPPAGNAVDVDGLDHRANLSRIHLSGQQTAAVIRFFELIRGADHGGKISCDSDR